MGEPSTCRQPGVRPHLAQIGRKCGPHGRTVAGRRSRGEGTEDRRRGEESAFDGFRGVMEQEAALPGITERAIHEFLPDRHPEASLPECGPFTKCCRSHGIGRAGAPEPEARPRFGTPPERQMQFDWKESLRMVDVNGEVFEFSVFSAALGHSRDHRLICSRTRTEDDLLACLLATLVRFGGMPGEAITDDMGALVTFVGGRRVKSERAWRLAREAGFGLGPCEVSTPRTKGKGESANRLASRPGACDHGLEGERGPPDATARIEARPNAGPSETTARAAAV
ncbi:hypothetical protein [Olsenella profusa]|nr:hypothetical protein [Olsenella profusa]